MYLKLSVSHAPTWFVGIEEYRQTHWLSTERQKIPWAVRAGEHPCGMLSFNDKWWMLHHDKKDLSRLGHKRREEMSCIPPQFRDGSWHKYSVESRVFLPS